MIQKGSGWAAFLRPGEDRKEAQDAYRVEAFGEDGLIGIVCDGHGPGGDEAARYVCSALPDLLRQGGFDHGREAAVTRDACVLLDQILTRRWSGGTTLTLAVLRPGSLFYAWVGDTRADMINGHGVHQLTRDHRADDPGEALEVVRRGGLVHQGRVRIPGSPKRGLMLARSLGDAPYGSAVSPLPECMLLPFLPGGVTRLKLATDGLWGAIDGGAVRSATVVEWCHHGTSFADGTSRLYDEVERLGNDDDATNVDLDLTPFFPY